MQNSLHSHRFMGRTTFNDGHIHEYSGITSVNLNSPVTYTTWLAKPPSKTVIYIVIATNRSQYTR